MQLSFQHACYYHRASCEQNPDINNTAFKYLFNNLKCKTLLY